MYPSTSFSLVLLAYTSFPARSISFHLISTVVSYILSLLNKTAKRCRLLTKDKMKKVLRTAITHAVDGKAWQKFSNPIVSRDKTVVPKKRPSWSNSASAGTTTGRSPPRARSTISSSCRQTLEKCPRQLSSGGRRMGALTPLRLTCL